MKFIIIDDENELFNIMFYDLNFNKEVEKISHFVPDSKIMNYLRKFHFNSKINSRINLPFKCIWKNKYTIYNYNYDSEEQYFILFLNGCLRFYYDRKILSDFKRKHPNVSLVLLLYDSHANPNSQFALRKKDLFDLIFTFDPKDAYTHDYEYIYSTLSDITPLLKKKENKSDIFYVGRAVNRLPLMHKVLKKISDNVKNCDFYISGIKNKNDCIYPDIIEYNKYIPYNKVLEKVLNTDCLIEFVMPNQTGITLRTCEAIIFNKKLITNNKELVNTPFYNPKYMKIFNDETDIDIEFIKRNIEVDYKYDGIFSPNVIMEKIKEIENQKEHTITYKDK